MTSLEKKIATLNHAQQQAVQHSSGPALILAGAGSGKTTVLTTRAAWLIDHYQLPSDQLLLVTFTNKAAHQMRNKVEELTGERLRHASTFHSFCAKILRRYGSALGLQPNFSIYDDDDQLSILKRILKDSQVDPKKIAPRAVKAQISRAKNEMLSPTQFAQFANNYFQQTVVSLYEKYQNTLAENQAVDFDDLLLKVVELLQTNPYVLESLQANFQHILVDEYQDTNKAQYTLTRLLAAPQHELFVVGDFAQSIYSWRGADYRNMLQLKQDFPDLHEYKLEQNYRSTQTILDAASGVIALTTAHPVLTLWTDRADTAPITLKELPDSRSEAEQVARWIIEQHRDYPLHEMAILYRTNAQSRTFEEILMRSGIPYNIIGGVTFYERKEVKDLLAYLRLVANPHDEASLIRVQKIGKKRLDQFLNWRNELLTATDQTEQSSPSHDSEVMGDGTNGARSPNRVLEYPDPKIDSRISNSDSPSDLLRPSHILDNILRQTSYLELYQPNDPDDLSRLENIQELRTVAAQFESLSQMLENIALMQNGALADFASDEPKSAVQMMSLHAAKGLEFSIVFLVGLEDGLLPHSRSLMEAEAMEEERRLCYVGMTRTKHQLFMSYAKSRFIYNSITTSTPSRFLKDIPDELLSTDSKHFGQTATTSSGRQLVIDDDLLEAYLAGEVDVKLLVDE